MDLYQALVLLHILATGGVFAGLGIEVAALRRVQRATTAAEARLWLPSLQHPGGMLPHLSMVTLILTGLGLAWQLGSMAPWMTAALVAIAFMVLLTVTLTGPALSRLAASLGSEGETPPEGWHEHARDLNLHLSAWLRVGLYLGVLGSMALKPHTVGAVATLTIAVGAGAAASVPLRPRLAPVEGVRR